MVLVSWFGGCCSLECSTPGGRINSTFDSARIKPLFVVVVLSSKSRCPLRRRRRRGNSYRVKLFWAQLVNSQHG